VTASARFLTIGGTCVLSLVRMGVACAWFAAAMSSSIAESGERPSIKDVTPPSFSRVYRSGERSGVIRPTEAQRFVARLDSNGDIQIDGERVKLHGLSLLPPRKICMSASGARWTCGQHAFMALHNLVDKKQIGCLPKDAAQPMIVICWVDGVNIAQRILQEGWADLGDGISEIGYVEAVKIAQARKRGLWSDRPAFASATTFRVARPLPYHER
jgi:endonuclease YncB( thermonuclease family)